MKADDGMLYELCRATYDVYRAAGRVDNLEFSVDRPASTTVGANNAPSCVRAFGEICETREL